ncbi:MAG: phospholipid transport system transporter-binding protein [Methylophilaceae bacterium]|jgi:phospholipid transport system transporter-binding protein|tara:strand:+ start:27063 stop:27344 length:282 start_codon:yes stop_codon:yes gene_type:complete
MTAITQNENRWDVTGNIEMDNANTLLKLSEALVLPGQAVVDFAKVAEVDTSAVSLMLEWQRRAQAENKQISFVNLPKSLTSLTVLYGVADLVS